MRCLLLTCVLVCSYSLSGDLFDDVNIKLRDRSVHRQLVKRVVQVNQPAEDPAPVEDPAPAENPSNEPAPPVTGEPGAGSAPPPPPPPAGEAAAQKNAVVQILGSLEDLKALLKADMQDVKESYIVDFISAQEISEENLETVKLEELMEEWKVWYAENGAGRECAVSVGLLLLTTLFFV